MAKYDVVFLHAPSVYDFRKKPIFYGPVSDVIPSSPVFEMYPIGFMTISAHLMAAGFRARIVNIANLMLSSEKFDAEKKIRGLDATVFAIDLHWMPHAHGAIELAKIVKKYHPDAKVEFGGFTSSYFYDELIRRPEIDLVMRGDTTEEPTVRMMQALERGDDLSSVPNLVWKDAGGKVHDNGVTWSLTDLDSVIFDYGVMIKGVMKTMDIKGSLPWNNWAKVPLTSVFTVRGCSVNCAECGGSHYANRKVVCRSRPAFRSPEKLVEDMEGIQDYMKAPIFIVGDIRQAGQDYCDRLLKAARESGIRNHVVIELFNGAGGEHFSKIDHAFQGGWSIEFSPDSYDEIVRLALGKGYTNDAIDKTIPAAFGNGCSRLDLFFMTGLPKQTRESALDTAKGAEHLWSLVDRDAGLFIYDAPFAPFVDPGSRAFEEPEKWGYKLRARTLEDHRKLLDSPSWKHVLSYETEFMTRDDIGEVSYDAALVLTDAEMHSGRISEGAARERNDRTEIARDMMHKVDEALRLQDPEERDARLWEIKDEGVRLMDNTITNKNNLDWHSGSIWRNAPRVGIGVMKNMFRGRR
ncbi:Fe-S oxidoreductase [Thermoplasmatales archaeon BRNA1]|nr:Fe-S oxidoreductase [Thermoplasmatales archaeon BRNA1]